MKGARRRDREAHGPRGRFEKVTVGLIPDHGGWRAVYADDEPGAVYTVPMVGWLVKKEMLVEGSEDDPIEAVLSAEHRSFVPGCMDEGEVLEPWQSNYLGLLEPGGDEKAFADASRAYHATK